MTALAKVIEVKENNIAKVESQRMSACASCENCSSKGACEAHLVFGDNSTVTLDVKNNLGAGLGDTVQLATSTPKMLFTSFCVFVLPVLLSLAVYFAVDSFTSKVVYPIVGLALSFGFGFLLAAVCMNKFAKKCINIEIVKIVEESVDNSTGEV